MLAIVGDGAPRHHAACATLVTIIIASLALAIAWYGIRPFGWFSSIWLREISAPFVLGAALLAGSQVFQSLAAADGNYRSLNIMRITQAGSITLLQIGGGLYDPTASTLALCNLAGLLIGLAVAVSVSSTNLGSGLLHASKPKELFAFWQQYRRFPLISLPADATNAASVQLPVILLTSRFGPDLAGYLALTFRVLGAPISLLANAVLDVFKRRAAAAWRQRGECRAEYTETAIILGLGAAAFSCAVMLSSGWLFAAAFGEKWRPAGDIAIWVLPLFALRFVASPLSYVLYIADRQHIDLAWQLSLLAVVLASFHVSATAEAAIRAYAIGYGLLYVVYLVLSYRASAGAKP